MLSPKNIVYLPQLKNEVNLNRQSSHNLTRKRYVPPEPIEHDAFKKIEQILVRLEALIQSEKIQNPILFKGLKEGIKGLKRITLSHYKEQVEQRQQKYEQSVYKSQILKLERFLREKQEIIISLKGKIKQMVSKFNFEMTAVLKKKILMESQTLNLNQIFKMTKLNQIHREIAEDRYERHDTIVPQYKTMQCRQNTQQSVGSKGSSTQANSDLKNVKSVKNSIERFAKELKLQKMEDSIKLKYEELGRKKDEIIQQLRQQINQKKIQKEAFANEILQLENTVKHKQIEIQTYKNEVQSVKIELNSKEESTAYLMKELNRRIEELQDQISYEKIEIQHVRKPSILEQQQKDVVKHECIYKMQAIEKEQAFIFRQQYYIRRINDLQEQLQK